jgi:hypothetical protein
MALNGPYTFRPLLKDVPLSSDDEEFEVVVTCADYWGARCCLLVFSLIR